MNKLLKADLARLFRSRIFWLAVIFMLCFASCAVLIMWNDMREYPNYNETPDSMLFSGTKLIGFVIAVVMGIFIGADYSNGTIRNKLISGHSRTAMYISDLITSVIASVILNFVWFGVIIGGSALGLMRKFALSVGTLTGEMLVIVFSGSAVAAVFLLVCMLSSSKTSGVVIVMILALAMQVAAMVLWSSLSEPEYYEAFDYIDVSESGELLMEHQERTRNQSYLDGTERRVCEVFYDVLPSCQMMQISLGDLLDDEGEPLGKMAVLPVYSLLVIAVTTAAGVLIFRRKDLK